MTLIVCGLNHKTADLAIREKLAFSPEAVLPALDALLAEPNIHEAVILSTCNRTEIYCELSDPDVIRPWLANYHHMAPAELFPYLYVHQDEQALQHMLRVAVGLDSMMLGEPQILGQLKQAFQVASLHGSISSHLQHVFQFIFGASKRIRNQSGIGHNATSIAYAAAQRIAQTFPDPSILSVLLIGSGETGALVAKYLYQLGIRHFIVASRSQDKALVLASQYQAQGIPISELTNTLPKTDIIVSATACPLPFISVPMVKQALVERQQAPMFFLDLAMPRDIEPAVKDLAPVTLYNIDDLHHVTQQAIQQRHVAAQHAEQLVAFESQQFVQNHRALRAKDLIRDYRNTMQKLADLELQRALQQLANGQAQLAVLTELSQRLIKKFAHLPTIGLRQAAVNQQDDILDFACNLLHSTKVTHEEIA